MNYFFQPNSKVQKDRHVMRETDERMAKYSRRGLIFNFIAFLICLIGGQIFHENKELTIVLASGLLLTTLFRGFYLFRFEQHYPRGPARWRNAYFIVTLLGAIWWGIILASITLVLGIEFETPLLWLYTIVFFSTTAHAFAPYHRFLSYYQFLGLIPAAASAVIIGTWTGYLYGGLMLMFYLILSHQCRLISNNYWEKLEAGYALGIREASYTQEKKNSLASVQLGQEFAQSLDYELNRIFDTNEADEHSGQHSQSIEQLRYHVGLFKDISRRKLKITPQVFNARHELQSIVQEFVGVAEKKEIQIESALSTNLPMRLKGDARLIAKILRTVLWELIGQQNASAIILEAQFLREFEQAGELYLSVKRITQKEGMRSFFGDQQTKSNTRPSLALTVAKGLAELLEGNIEVVEKSSGEISEIRVRTTFAIVERSGQLDFHKGRFNGKRFLLVNPNASIAEIKRDELQALGFETEIETDYKRVSSSLVHNIKSGQPYENILFYCDANDKQAKQTLASLTEIDELKSLNKIIACTNEVKKDLMDRGYGSKQSFYYVEKPVGLFELESAFDYMYNLKGDEASLTRCRAGTVIIVSDEKESGLLEENCEKLPQQNVLTVPVNQLEKALNKAENPMVVVPCYAGEDFSKIIDITRTFQSGEEEEGYTPVIGVGQNCSKDDIDAYEIGFDDFINPGNNDAELLVSKLRYWCSLG